jgi:hypothetical protein
MYIKSTEEPDGPTASALGLRLLKLSNVRKRLLIDGWTKIYYLELFGVS